MEIAYAEDKVIRPNRQFPKQSPDTWQIMPHTRERMELVVLGIILERMNRERRSRSYRILQRRQLMARKHKMHFRRIRQTSRHFQGDLRIAAHRARFA